MQWLKRYTEDGNATFRTIIPTVILCQHYSMSHATLCKDGCVNCSKVVECALLMFMYFVHMQTPSFF